MKNELDNMSIALQQYITEKSISQNEVAKRIGISSSYITHALNKNWDRVPAGKDENGNARFAEFSEQVAKKILLFLGIDAVTVWQTDNFTTQLLILTEAKQHHEHRIIDGEKGTGKTYTAEYFKKEYPKETYLITCSEDMNPKSFVMELAKQIGVNAVGDRRTIRLAIAAKLKQMKYPIIIIDEAENLKNATYGSIKALYDEVKDYCAIVMIGANNYMYTLKKKAEAGRACFPQIYSRFNAEPAYLQQLTRKEVVYICKLSGITDKETISALQDKCSDFRELDRNIKRTLRDAQIVTAN